MDNFVYWCCLLFVSLVFASARVFVSWFLFVFFCSVSLPGDDVIR